MALRTLVMVPTREKALEQLVKLSEDIKLIREREGLSYERLGSALGVSKVEVFHWEKGNRVPRESLIWLSLIMWADELRSSPS